MTTLRRHTSGDFLQCYKNLCAKQSVCPINSMRAHKAKISNAKLSIKVDRLQPEDWYPLLDAIACNKSLQTVVLQSIWFQVHRKVLNESDRRRNRGLIAPHLRHPPTIHAATATYDLAKALKAMLMRNPVITRLELVGIPFRHRDIKLISEGIAHAPLVKLRISDANLDNQHCAILSDALHVSSTLTTADLSRNAYTTRGLRFILDVLKSQAANRGAMAWHTSLRGRQPDMRVFTGILNLDVSANPQLGDEAVTEIYNVLIDDLWLLRLSLRDCGITSASSHLLHTLMAKNSTLIHVDLSENQLSLATLQVCEKHLAFNRGETRHRPWDEHKLAAQKNWNTMHDDLSLVHEMSSLRRNADAPSQPGRRSRPRQRRTSDRRRSGSGRRSVRTEREPLPRTRRPRARADGGAAVEEPGAGGGEEEEEEAVREQVEDELVEAIRRRAQRLSSADTDRRGASRAPLPPASQAAAAAAAVAEDEDPGALWHGKGTETEEEEEAHLASIKAMLKTHRFLAADREQQRQHRHRQQTAADEEELEEKEKEAEGEDGVSVRTRPVKTGGETGVGQPLFGAARRESQQLLSKYALFHDSQHGRSSKTSSSNSNGGFGGGVRYREGGGGLPEGEEDVTDEVVRDLEHLDTYDRQIGTTLQSLESGQRRLREQVDASSSRLSDSLASVKRLLQQPVADARGADVGSGRHRWTADRGHRAPGSGGAPRRGSGGDVEETGPRVTNRSSGRAAADAAQAPPSLGASQYSTWAPAVADESFERPALSLRDLRAGPPTPQRTRDGGDGVDGAVVEHGGRAARPVAYGAHSSSSSSRGRRSNGRSSSNGSSGGGGGGSGRAFAGRGDGAESSARIQHTRAQIAQLKQELLRLSRRGSGEAGGGSQSTTQSLFAIEETIGRLHTFLDKMP